MPLRFAAPLALALLSSAAAAQEASSAAPEARKVDESALRYYAEHNEADYYAAEVRRLRTLYPDWTPPADSASLATVDDLETPLWNLFAKGDWDGLDKAMSALKGQHPEWTGSPDLVAKIAQAKARAVLIAASDKGDWAEVKRLAGSSPNLGGCTDLEAAWRIAAARAQSGEQAAALSDYRALLSTCTDAPGRHATVEKALASLGPASARPLLALGARDAAGKGEFDDLALAFTRAEIAARLADAGAAEPSAESVRTFAAAALDASAADAQLLGWFFRQKGDHRSALEAFEAASTLLGAGAAAAERPEITEGIVLSLAGVERRAEAIDLARSSRKLSPNLAKIYVELGAERFEGSPRPRVADGEIADYAAAVLEVRSAVGAEAVGWYAYDFRQWGGAARWFDTALAWAGEDGSAAPEGAARGAVLAAAAGGDKQGAKAILAKWEPSFPGMGADLRALLQPPPKSSGRPAPAAGKGGGDPLSLRFHRKDFSGCVALAKKLGRLSAGQRETLGWCLLKLNRPSEAAESFAAAAGGAKNAGDRQNAVYGRSLALFAAGDPRGAAELAGTEAMTGKRRNEIGVAVLADQAIAAFDRRDWQASLDLLDQRRRFASETMDLSTMRGWALVHLGRRAQAEKIFRRMDRTLSTPETRRALAKLAESGARTE